MKITFLKDCLLLRGVQKKGSTLLVDDAFAQRLNAAGISKQYEDPVEASAGGTEKTENKAENPDETKEA